MEQICKVRFIARSSQDSDACDIRNDFLICSKDVLCIPLTIMAANQWMCKSMNMKIVFLQSKQLGWLVNLDSLRGQYTFRLYLETLKMCI